MTKLSDLIKEKRTAANLSLREFAKRCGLSHQYIENLEKHDPRTGREVIPGMRSLEKLAPALDMALETLLEEIGYIETLHKLEPSSLALVRNGRSFEELCADIESKTGIRVSPNIYEALEKGKNSSPSPLFIDTLAKYVNVDPYFFYRKNTPEDFEKFKSNTPYLYVQDDIEEICLVKEKGFMDFVHSPDAKPYIMLAQDLYENKIDVDSIRKEFLKENK